MIGRLNNDKIGILLVTAPKSGTHLMIEIMQQTFGSYFTYRGGWGDPPENSVNWIKMALLERKDMNDPLLTTLKRTRVMAPTHTSNAGFDVLANAIAENEGMRGIFLFRDPRDLVISVVKSTTSKIWPEGHLEGQMAKLKSDEDRFNWVLKNYGPHKGTKFRSFLGSYHKFFESDLFLNVRYEDLMGMRRGGNAWTFGATVDGLARLTNCDSHEMAHGILDALNRSNWTHRTDGARASQWKDLYTASNKKVAKEILGQQLINWGFEKNMEW